MIYIFSDSHVNYAKMKQWITLAFSLTYLPDLKSLSLSIMKIWKVTNGLVWDSYGH